MATRDSRLLAAKSAINSIGFGFDITHDINFYKSKSRFIVVNEEQCRPLEIPGGISIPNVPNSIRCVKGESIRIQSEVLTLQQHFNQEMCLEGKTASGHFRASFGLSGRSIKDLDTIKSLAYDGWFIKRYGIELERCHGELIELHNQVKEAVPSSWDPKALARFIKLFGTHVIVGVSMGGKDVLYVRQEDSSYLDPTSIQKLLEDKASKMFMDSSENHCRASEVLCNKKEVPRQWARVLNNDIRPGYDWKHPGNIWLQPSFLGPRLYVNTIPVDVGNRPVTGLRLQLEEGGRLAIQLQHLASLPKSFPLSDNPNVYLSCDSDNFHNIVKWNCWSSISYVCTAPIESRDSLSIVTGAQLQVENMRLLLRLRFSEVLGATLQKQPEWEQSSSIGQFNSKTGGISAFITKEGQKEIGDKITDSTTFPVALPEPVLKPKLLRFVDTTEVIRGPEDSPGYWVVSGARLSVHNGKICLLVKYSLLRFVIAK